MSFIYKVCLYTVRFFFMLIYRIKFIGCENIPTDNGYIIATNHRGLSDPIFISIGCTKRKINYLAKSELFKNTFMNNLLRFFGTTPVDRGKADMDSLSCMIDMLRNNMVVGIFIEGTRSLNTRPGAGKSGAALLSREAHCAIIPCAVIYYGKLRLFKKIIVSYGKPIENSQLFPEDSKSLRYATNLVMQNINILMDEQGVPRAEDNNS